MTTDSVFAIFSTTKAITGTAVLQLVEDGIDDVIVEHQPSCSSGYQFTPTA